MSPVRPASSKTFVCSKGDEIELIAITGIRAEVRGKGGNPKSGDPRHGEFEGLFKFRVGDYRVIYALTGEDVLVLRIRRRSKAYG